MNDIIRPGNVNGEKLLSLFQSEPQEPIADKDGNLHLLDAQGYYYSIFCDADRCLLTFHCAFPFSDQSQHVEKLMLVNQLNCKVVFTRFSMESDCDLVADYDFTYSEGMRASHFIDTSKWFEQTVVRAIKKYDKTSLVRL